MALACSKLLSSSGLACQVITLDHWIIPLSERPIDSVVLNRFDITKLMKDLRDLLEGTQVSLYPYDTRTREKSKAILSIRLANELDYLIIEGVIALLLEDLRVMADLKLFVESNHFLRIKRLISLYRDEKKLQREDYKAIIRSRELEEVPLVSRSRNFAEIILDNSSLIPFD